MASAYLPAPDDVTAPAGVTGAGASLPAAIAQEPSWYLHRPRLDALLERLQGEEAKILGLWDAAGSGKTTLMAAWARRLHTMGHEVAWFAAQDLVDTTGPADVLSRLVTPAASSVPPGELVVFVDDVHLLDPVTLAGLLAQFGQSARGTRFVLAARYRPFSGTAPLEAAGVLIECPDDTLAFTPAEIALLALQHGITLPVEDAAVLWRHTGGWATGLALALTLRATEGDSTGLRRFNGDNRAVADYLAAEVVIDLDDGDREVLMHSAVSEIVPLELSVALTHRTDAGDVLARIARHNTLVGRETDASGSDAYRFHPILLAYLQAEGRRRDAADATARHLLACRWYSDRADGAAALEQSLLAREPGRIGETLERFGLELALTGSTERVGRALRRIHGVVASTATLALRLLLEAPYFPARRRAHQLLLAADASISGAVSADEVDATGPVSAAGPGRRERWSAVVAALHAFAATERADIEVRLNGLHSADPADARPVDLAVDLLAATAEGRCLDELGHPAAAEATLRDAAESAKAAGYDWLFLLASDLAATAAAHGGNWRHVAMLEDQLAAAAPGNAWPVDVVGGRAMLYGLVRRYERCEPVDAGVLAALAVSAGPWLDSGVSVPARALQLLVQLDDASHPRQSLDHLTLLMREVGSEHPRALSLCCVPLIALSGALDGRAEAQLFVRLVERVLGEESLEALLLRFLLVPPTRAGHPAEERLRAAAVEERTGWRGATIVSAWVALAAVADISGRHVECDARLLRALRLADQLGAERALIAVGGQGASLIRARLGRLGDLDDFARHVLRRADRLRPAERVPAPERSQGGSVLTQRERELLRELPFHQSVADIARKRNVSPNTVKTHLRNIYQKLEATNRAEAVVIAQDRGLL